MRWPTRVALFTVSAFTLVAAALPSGASAAEIEVPRITVRGQGVVTVRPDLAVLTMGANVRRESAAAAFEQSNLLIAQLNQALREQGIAERDITTRQFDLSPEYGRPPEGGIAPVVAWRSTNILSIKVRDFDRIGAVIDAGARILGNDAQISGISFTVEDTDAVARRARDAAIANARERGDQIATAAGVRIVRILSITETSAPPPTPVAFLVARPVAAAPQRGGADVAPGEQSIIVTVEIVFEIG